MSNFKITPEAIETLENTQKEIEMENIETTPEEDRIRVINKFISEESYYNELEAESSGTINYEKVKLQDSTVYGFKDFSSYDLKLNLNIPLGYSKYEIIDKQLELSKKDPSLHKMIVTVEWIDQDGELSELQVLRGYDFGSEDELHSKKIMLEDLTNKALDKVRVLSSYSMISSGIQVTVIDQKTKSSSVYTITLGQDDKAIIDYHVDDLLFISGLLATDFYTPYYSL